MIALTTPSPDFGRTLYCLNVWGKWPIATALYYTALPTKAHPRGSVSVWRADLPSNELTVLARNFFEIGERSTKEQRMRKRTGFHLAFFALGLTGFSQEAGATEMTGNDLLRHCQASDTANWERGLCDGYIGATVDVLGVLPGAKICISSEADYGQLVDITIKYLKNHPETRHELASGLIAVALRQAFPCSLKR
jgi:hypothetical protein